MKNIETIGIDIGKRLSKELMEESEGYVGAESEENFTVNSKQYKVKVWAFWESSNHFSYLITGDGFKASASLLSF